MIELAALDMAGTTVNESGAVYRALRTAVERTGVPVSDEDLQTWMGTDKREAIAALVRLGGGTPTPELVEDGYEAFAAFLREAYRARPPQAIEGVEDALAELRRRGIKVALTTGFSADVAHPLLESLGWSTGEGGNLDAVVTSDEVPRGRPAPHMIHRAMEKTGVIDTRRVLAAGDTIVDVEAGTNAGAGVVVGVLTGELPRAAFAGHPHARVLASAAELPTLPETFPQALAADLPTA
ncbi:phosphonatase-like hydrolase [Streptomyces sp. SP17BM10]|uniref:phosphonatase-like hydrolase n=1 Tax=Streptomyces sp. SP17BM10 TaxID=3002530 RepID=UPI002E770405|nr:phosphonatase-like hydrolase [Streptomyces sp. SP17BM10]MEE1786206.1 phosphonatase-like hydrolase [Streptomyces sp. SP17BM10]